MAKVSANTYVTNSNNLIKEDIADRIYNISPEFTPIASFIGTAPCQSRSPIWYNDSYRAPKADNKSAQGSAAVAEAVTGATKLGNHTQILKGVVSVDDAMKDQNIYGNFNKLGTLIAKKGVEIRRDWEKVIISSQASIAGTDATAGQSAGLGSFIKTNIDKASGGSVPGYQNNGTITERSKGTARTVTEAILENVLVKRFETTGEPTDKLSAFCSMKMKQKLATTLTGRNIDRADNDGTIVNGNVDVYVSPAGSVKIVPHYMMDDEAIFFVDSTKAHTGVHRNYQTKDLGAKGDATERQLLMENTLILTSEDGHGAAYDLKVS